jgi:hypothetical protein
MTTSHVPPRRRALVLCVAVAAALLAGAALLGWLGRPHAHPDRAADGADGAVSPTSPPASGPGAASDGAVDRGFAHDQTGAVNASVAYAVAWRQWWLSLSDEQLTEALAGVAAPAAVDALAVQATDEIRPTRELLAESKAAGAWVDPLAWRVETYNATYARVALWTMRVLAVTAAAVPQSEWAMVTVDLEWTGGDWRLAGIATRPGPSPMTGPHDGPWDTARFRAALESFDPVARPAGSSTPSPPAVEAWFGTGRDTPDSFRRDEGGAVDAALAYTAASQAWLYLGEHEVAKAVTQIATPQAADTLVAEVVHETTTAREGLAESEGPVWWWVDPLAARLEAYSRSEARVAVWTLTVLSAEGVAVPQSEWITVTVDLEWDGGWRVAAIGDRPGPTPIASPSDDPWDALAFADTLAGFTRLGEEPLP